MKKFTNSSMDYFEALGQRESSGRYNVVNPYGYLGKYQMGEGALADAGYYKKASHNYNNDWSGQFTGKDGVYSKQDFLNNKIAQENAVRIYSNKVWDYIKDVATEYDGKTINGIPITQSGMLAGAHLVGQRDLKKYLLTNGQNIKSDRNQVSVEEYLKRFANYPVYDITLTPPKENKQDVYKRILNPIHNSYSTGFAAPAGHVFTREDFKNMSKEEFVQNEKAIMKQLKERGIPTRDELKKQQSSSHRSSNSGSDSDGGHWVTINGNHVLMKD